MNEIYVNLHNRSPKHQAMNTLDVQVKKMRRSGNYGFSGPSVSRFSFRSSDPFSSSSSPVRSSISSSYTESNPSTQSSLQSVSQAKPLSVSLSLQASLSSPASSSGVSSDHSSGSTGSSGFTSSRFNRSFGINDKLSRYDGIGYTEENDGEDTSSNVITVSKNMVSSTGGYRTLDRVSPNKNVTTETVNLSTSIVISEDDCSLRKISTLDRGSSSRRDIATEELVITEDSSSSGTASTLDRGSSKGKDVSSKRDNFDESFVIRDRISLNNGINTLDRDSSSAHKKANNEGIADTSVRVTNPDSANTTDSGKTARQRSCSFSQSRPFPEGRSRRKLSNFSFRIRSSSVSSFSSSSSQESGQGSEEFWNQYRRQPNPSLISRIVRKAIQRHSSIAGKTVLTTKYPARDANPTSTTDTDTEWNKNKDLVKIPTGCSWINPHSQAAPGRRLSELGSRKEWIKNYELSTEKMHQVSLKIKCS